MKKKISISFLLVIICYSGYTWYNSLTDKALFIPGHQLRHQTLISKIPDDLFFAGEKVHFKDPEDYKRFYNEIKINTSQNSSTRLLMKHTRIWLPQMAKILKANNIPEDFQYVAVAESNLNNSVSPMGAAGFWQFQAPTAIELGLEVNTEVDERYHAMKATQAACKYFRQAHDLFGTWTSAAASYNSGMNGLLQAFRKQSVSSFYDLDLNDETAKYIYRILSIKDLLKNPKKYGMKVKGHRVAKIRKIKIEKDIKDLTKFAIDNKTNITTLKELNPWLLKNSLTIKTPGASYILLLPVKEEFHSTLQKDSSSGIGHSSGISTL